LTQSIALIVCIIFLPLIGHYRRWPPTRFFAFAALFYAIGGAINLASVEIARNILQGPKPQFHDTYYVVKPGYISLNHGVIMAAFAALTWLQTRLNAMLYPRITKALFWLLHLGLSASSSIATGLTSFFTMPRRYVDYPEMITRVNLIGQWGAIATIVATVCLFALFVWSFVARRSCQ